MFSIKSVILSKRTVYFGKVNSLVINKFIAFNTSTLTILEHKHH